jgi:hypothetical protein
MCVFLLQKSCQCPSEGKKFSQFLVILGLLLARKTAHSTGGGGRKTLEQGLLQAVKCPLHMTAFGSWDRNCFRRKCE